MIVLLLIPIILFFCFFILHILSKNDFILLRKGIPLSVIFNNVFLSLFFAFLTGRLLYFLETRQFLNLLPLSFFHVANIPGFLMLGAPIGATLSLLLFLKSARARVFDIFSLSFYPFVFLYIFVLPFPLYLLVVLFILLFISFVLFLNYHKNYTLRDGSVYYSTLIILSFLHLVSSFRVEQIYIVERLSFNQILAASILCITIVALLINEQFIRLKRS